MKRVFTSPDSAEVGLLKSLLEQAGIECFTRNETQAYPGAAFHPELWIVRDEDEPAAEKICREWRQSTADQTRWKCNTCGEELEGQFASCWNCGSPRTEVVSRASPAALAPSQDVSVPETTTAPPFVWKPFPDFIVILLAIAAFALEMYYRGIYRSDPIATLRYPVHTALRFTGQQMSLAEGWKGISGFPSQLRDWYELTSDHDPTSYCEYVLRDTLAYLPRSRRRSTNALELRANLVVLLAENGRWQECTNDLRLLQGDPVASHFVLAAQTVYGTNKNISVSEIHDPVSVLGNTWFETKFDSRWSKLKGDGAEAARLTKWLADDAAQTQKKDFIVIVVGAAGQVLGLVGLGWAFLARRHLVAFRRNLAVAWEGWEGLGIVFAAWALGILLNIALYTFGLGTVSYFGHDLIMWTPLVWLLWQRHGRQNGTSLKQLFSLSPISTRGAALIAAGLAVFLLEWLAYEGVAAAAQAIGLRGHWAESLYEGRLYEPWSLRWMLVLNAVLLGPVGEELLNRGVLFPALRKWVPTIAAALLSAVVFALPHYYGWPGFLALVAFGTVSALSVYCTGSLIPAIIAHALTNLIVVGSFCWIFGE